MSFIIVWKVAGELVSPKNMTSGSKRPRFVLKAALNSSPSLMRILLYPHRTSSLVKYLAFCRVSMSSVIKGRGYLFLIVILLSFRLSWTGRSLPSFFLTKKKGEAIGDLEDQMRPVRKCSSKNSSSCSCSSWDKG